MTEHERAPLLGDSRKDEEIGLISSPGVSKLAISALLLGSFLANADDSFVLTTVSDISASLGAANATTWILTSYNVGYIIALPLYGQLCDMVGRKKTLMLAYLLYICGCTLAGTSSTVILVIFGRVISGLGGSGMVELVSVVFNENGSSRQVALLRSYATVASMLGQTCGAPLGGMITSWVGWRWAFIGHVPLATLCIVIVSSTLTADKHHSATPSIRAILRSFDVPGLLLLIPAILCFLWNVQLLPAFGEDETNRLLMIACPSLVILLLSFCLVEGFWAEKPLIPLSLLKPSQFGLFYGIQVCVEMSSFCILPIISDYWVRVKGLPPAGGALFYLPIPIGFGVGSVIGARLIQRTGHWRRWCIIGILIGATCYTLILIRWNIYEPYFWEAIYPFILFAGLAMLYSAQFVALAALAPKECEATAITTYYLSQQVGVVTGVAVTNAMSRRVFKWRLEGVIEGDGESLELVKHLISDRLALADLPMPLRETVRVVFRQGYMVCPAVALAGLSLVMVGVVRQRPVALT
ncbi:major facilitator superfamily domain-containing protein [Aspergillus venezuelensis]